MEVIAEPMEDNIVSRRLGSRSDGFFSWREFGWGALASGFGETLLHPVDTLKTRIQSGGQTGFSLQKQSDIGHALKYIVGIDGVRGLYRGVVPGLTGSMVTGATYFGFIESSKDWLEGKHPNLAGPWAHFLAGATGDTLGSIVYVPCEVLKQRMQIQGSSKTWHRTYTSSIKKATPAVYYSGAFHAGRVILRQEGLTGLYAGYFSTLVRDVPFAGLQIMLYEAMRASMVYGKEQWGSSKALQPVGLEKHQFSSLEELIMGGTAGGLSAFLTTPMDVLKTRLQVQGSSARYKGWRDALQTIWREEGTKGFFKGALPRVLWFVPASAISFMAVEWLRKEFNPLPVIQVDSQPVLSSSSPIDITNSHPRDIQVRVNPHAESGGL
ncbi:hypothetical protein CY35_07G101200 [Sphagnum magellanicum]|uniref:Uncharacterized protein n=1 Tax=Sphagnum magellanicum TaxID=128215 RepID=A0ACB8HNV4_9BRYO|nr:hypothetical protein CY35_07G101200 [Sphagnum magellanicum]